MESKHRLPVKPEVAVPEVIVEIVADFFIFEILFGRHEQSVYLHGGFFIKSEFVVGVRVFATVDCCAAKRIVGVFFIESVILVEGTRERLQAFEGIVIAKKNGGVRESFTVRRVSFGIGIERTFQLHSPRVDKIELVRHGKVRRAKLYYLRDLSGKAAKIKEQI